MVEFDLECLEMCGKLALEEKDKLEREESSDEESSGISQEEEAVEDNQKINAIVSRKLVSEMESLNVEENSKTVLRPKITELD
jgi:hypothetical protein